MENEPVATVGEYKSWVPVLIGLPLFAASFLICAGVLFPIQALFYLALGWIPFLIRVVPQMAVSISGLVTALLLIVLMVVLIQLLGTLITRQIRNKDTATTLPRWRLRWTCAVLVLLSISFTGGFAVVGVAHQTSWLFTTEKRVLQTSYERGDLSRKIATLNTVRNVGLAVVNYSSSFENHLPTGVISSTGQPLHSWATQILPFLDSIPLYRKVDFTQPWNSSANSEVFKTSLPFFLTAGSDQPDHNEDGYGLSSYSLNKHVFYPGSTIRYDQVPDGLANTIMVGEVISRVPAWGDPNNIRDPALGINQHADGFGSSWKQGGACFIFLDGSAKILSDDIDPQILKALSTPDAGDSVGDFRK